MRVPELTERRRHRDSAGGNVDSLPTSSSACCPARACSVRSRAFVHGGIGLYHLQGCDGLGAGVEEGAGIAATAPMIIQLPARWIVGLTTSVRSSQGGD
jgi:hypothetical protein